MTMMLALTSARLRIADDEEGFLILRKADQDVPRVFSYSDELCGVIMARNQGQFASGCAWRQDDT
jgi:hypothetical protein